MKSSVIIICFFIAGILLGRIHAMPLTVDANELSLAVLYALIFFVGFSIGSDTSVLSQLRSLNPRIALLPAMSLLGTMAMLVVAVLGILIANAVLQLISRIFQFTNTTKLSTALFDACVGDWINGYSPAEFDVSKVSVNDILGDYNTALWVWPTSWKKNGMVNPNTFMYFPSMVASIALGIAMIVAIINLAKRVFEMVFLFLVMPLSMSTLAADDGARMKVWRESFISKIVLAYGAVFSVNIFLLLLPLLMQLEIKDLGGFGNSLFLIFMIVGGAMVIPAGMGLFARLFGQGEDVNGGSFLRSAFYGSRFAGLAAIGLTGKALHLGYKGARGLAHKINKNGGSDGNSGNASGGADSGDKYTETPAANTGESE